MPGNQWLKIRQEYRALKDFADEINSLFGTLVTLYIFRNLLYYALHLVSFSSLLACIQIFHELLEPVAILLMSADLPGKNIKTLKCLKLT